MERLDPDLRALQEVRDCMRRAVEAQRAVAHWSQAQIDDLCRAMAKAGAAAAADLARLAVEETGIGRAHYKVLKNLFATEGIWASIESEPTVGIVRRDEAAGVIEVATPIGVIAGIVPTTNPTSTALGKALIAVKGRNAIVISPHPRAARCIGESAEVLRRAVSRAGGPPDLVQSLSSPTIQSTEALMHHPDTKLILATGGAGLVKAAYSSGKPAYGVGPGNVPVWVDRSANLAEAAHWIVASQSFDNATLCCSEQALVLDAPIAERMLSELGQRGAHLCSPDETRALERLANRGGHMNPDLVGLDPWRVAEMAGFRVSRSTSVLLAHQGGVGPEHPLSIEILCPLLSVHVVDGWERGCEVSFEILRNGGLGHTIGVWATDQRVLEAWYVEKPASRIVSNGPTSQGAVGYSTGLAPSMSLGCGPLAGNITSDNITARHMINLKRVGLRRADWEQRYERDMRRAAELMGDRSAVPRGSMLEGDPALARGGASNGAAAVAATAQSSGSSSLSWAGNPAVSHSAASPSARAASAPRSAPANSQGPRSPRPGEMLRAASAPRLSPIPPGGGDALAMPLPAQGGSGCPLGPCRGCPHQDTKSGACTA
ncbi:aldehyde dehydrogenase family protein [Engelhardtia mirabilis]|uniref:Aldehyde-alcohol dehydrogenase n=1 Tax=Engelhardtia mirabilis TaxID=2528011 RepID=A0A518BPX9_9BACT|nr:Aldehyde-alcohol dehydrogenase [Planctomycetes bacterium Pla133]QDV03350.1 Aldehyde-alcohol dehydrogenase [Planctomycetes bacterium Pla86]